MKYNILIIILFFARHFSNAQEVKPMENLQGDVLLKATDNQLLATQNGKEQAFAYYSEPPYFYFQNDTVANNFLITYGIDTNEINNWLGDAQVKMSSANKLLTRVVNTPQGILLNGNADNTIAEEPGGTIVTDDNATADSQKSDWWKYALGGLALALIGLGIGFGMGKNANKKSIEIPKDAGLLKSEEEAPKATNATDQKKLDAAIAKVKALQAEQKNILKENADLKKQLSNDANFRKLYFTNAMSDLIVPFNNAMEQNDQAKSVYFLLKMAAHFSSITRHELTLKQANDEDNIKAILHQNVNANIPTVSINSAPDKTPKVVRNVQELMKKNNVSSLDEAVIFGYKINS